MRNRILLLLLGGLSTLPRAAEASLAAGEVLYEATLTYGPAPKHMHYFGQWLLLDSVSKQRVMFLGINSAVKSGLPTNTRPGDPGSYNEACQTWWADRIWMMCHSGDGRDPAGWGQPELTLTIGGPGESALIGDPCVVQWRGQWHMYYEGTDDCQGLGNRIFHAVAAHWRGPWRKLGAAQGLQGNTGGSGMSWPTVLVDEGALLLYYTDGSARLLCARCTDDGGQRFETVRFDGSRPLDAGNPRPVVAGEWVNRGQVVRDGNRYLLIYDAGKRSAIKTSVAITPFAFEQGRQVLATSPQRTWDNLMIGLPCVLKTETGFSVYYTGDSSLAPGGGAIGVFPLDVSALKPKQP